MDKFQKSIHQIKNKRFWFGLFLAVFLSMVIASPIYFYRITKPVDNDYAAHVMAAQELLGTGKAGPHLSHPLLQIILIGIVKLSFGHLGFYAALIILQVLVQCAITAIIYIYLNCRNNSVTCTFWRVFAAVTIPLLGPFMLLALKDGLFYYGYISIANYHNPTVHLLKPFALLCVIISLKAFESPMLPKTQVVLAAVLTCLSALAKPNFLIIFLPALFVLVLVQRIKKNNFDLKALVFGFFVPGIFVLFGQWFYTYASVEQQSGIIFAPFLVESAFSAFLLPKFLLSSLFVIQGSILFRKELITKPDLFMGLLLFLFGIAQYYLFAESGFRLEHANFRWSAQIGLFLFTVLITRRYFEHFLIDGVKNIIQRTLALITYGAHLIGGIAYYVYCLTSVHYR